MKYAEDGRASKIQSFLFNMRIIGVYFINTFEADITSSLPNSFQTRILNVPRAKPQPNFSILNIFIWFFIQFCLIFS